MRERVGPAHVVIVTPELWGLTSENGGISTSVFHYARLFRNRGDRVTVLVGLAKDAPLDNAWAQRYSRAGIDIRAAVAEPSARPLDGAPRAVEFPFRAISEAVADALPADADVIYFQDWSALGFETIRRRCLAAAGPPPVVVTVLRGSSRWATIGLQRPLDDSAPDRAERFAVEHSDLVVSPSSAYRDLLADDGVRLAVDGRTRVLGHPWLPLEETRTTPRRATRSFRRLVFFGRLETRKGFDLFLEALRLFGRRRPDLLSGLEQLVFLGREGSHGQQSLDAVADEVSSLAVEAVFLTDLDSWEAHEFLSETTSDALVVMPSLRENFPNAVIEASLVPGLNVICADVGGVGEILGPEGESQLFGPTPSALADALESWLDRGPKPATELASYDWESANERWLSFHEEALALAYSAASTRRSRRSPRRAVGRVDASVRLSIVVSTYEWPEALDAVLRSLADQSDSRFDVVVTDDGSGSETEAVVERWRTAFGKRIAYVWQSDQGFRLARARNRGALATRSGFLVFLDGDCIPRRHFVRALRASGRPGWFAAARRLALSRALTERVLTEQTPVHRWSFARWLAQERGDSAPLSTLTTRDRRKVGRANAPDFAPRENAYSCIGVASADFEAVDGYDMRYVGWGEEDVDIALRLRRLGLRCGHPGPQGTVLHLWHPTRDDPEHPNASLLHETKHGDRIESVEGLRELAAELGSQVSANLVGASSSSSEPANR